MFDKTSTLPLPGLPHINYYVLLLQILLKAITKKIYKLTDPAAFHLWPTITTTSILLPSPTPPIPMHDRASLPRLSWRRTKHSITYYRCRTHVTGAVHILQVQGTYYRCRISPQSQWKTPGRIIIKFTASSKALITIHSKTCSAASPLCLTISWLQGQLTCWAPALSAECGWFHQRCPALTGSASSALLALPAPFITDSSKTQVYKFQTRDRKKKRRKKKGCLPLPKSPQFSYRHLKSRKPI